MTSPLDEKAEHPRIWLEPAGAPDRCWCSDNQWDEEGVEYVLATQAQSALAAMRVDRDSLQAALNGVRDNRDGLLAAAEAQVKRLTEDNEALRVGVEHVETLSELLKIIKDHWVDYDHVFSIAVDEADKFVSSQALSGSKE